MTFAEYDHLSYWPEVNRKDPGLMVAALVAHDPSLNEREAFTIANDILEMPSPFDVRTKDDIWDGVIAAGPYARMRFFLNVVDLGRFPKDDLLQMFPTVWKASRFWRMSGRMLTFWERLARGGRATWTDAEMPDGRYIEVFRGQDARHPAGFCWTTDRAVAERHAHGDFLRKVEAPVVLSGRVPRRLVLGYVNGMNESEVIVAPIAVRSGPRHGPRIEAL